MLEAFAVSSLWLFVLALLVLLIYALGKSDLEDQRRAFEVGGRHYRSGIPADANPYDNGLARCWLDGWIAAQQEYQKETGRRGK